MGEDYLLQGQRLAQVLGLTPYLVQEGEPYETWCKMMRATRCSRGAAVQTTQPTLDETWRPSNRDKLPTAPPYVAWSVRHSIRLNGFVAS